MPRPRTAVTTGLIALALACPAGVAALPAAAPPSPAGSATVTDAGTDARTDAGATPAPEREPAGPAVLPPVQAESGLRAAAVARRIAPELADPRLGQYAVIVRDGLTGETLFQASPDRPQKPASTAKLLTALAVVDHLDTAATFRTRVVQGSRPGEIVLVAGGDQMLATGEGDPGSVPGRAGLADLAEQVAGHLDQATRAEGVTLRLDTTYAAGPSEPASWEPIDTAEGWAGRITMLGLDDDRAAPFEPQSADPAATAAVAFAQALRTAGVKVGGAKTVADIARVKSPARGEELGAVESATVGEVLSQGLLESDNAILESLARMAAVQDGASTDPAAVAAWVTRQVRAAGIDTTGVRLQDASGLARKQVMPARVVADIVSLAATGRHPALRDVLSRLPVSGLSGTLDERYLVPETRAGAGLVRAKTGSLPEASALAGSLMNQDGDLMTFTVFTQGFRTGVDSMNARTAIDEVTTALATCDCDE